MTIVQAAIIAALTAATITALTAWAVRRADRNLNRHTDPDNHDPNDPDDPDDHDDHDERDLHAETWTAHDEAVYRKLTRWKRNGKK